MAHPSGGHHPQHAVHQSQAGPEDGHHGKLLALEGGSDGGADGGLHRLLCQGQIPGGLVGQEHSNLGDQLPEVLGGGVLIPQNGQLVGHQGVVHDMQLALVHGQFSLIDMT